MARWQPVSVVGGAYTDDTKPWASQDCVNRIPVMAEREGTRSPAMLRDAPGCAVFAVLDSAAPIRGLHNAEGKLFAVSGQTLYQVSVTGIPTALGTIPGVGRVRMAHNQISGGNEVAIANGQSGYVYNTVTGVLAQITDPGFPGAKVFDFCDGYMMFVEKGGRYWGHSNLADAHDYNTLDRSEAEAQPDKIVTAAVSHREWVVFGERSTEFYRNEGGTTGTFQRINGTEAEIGAAGTHTVAKLDNTLFVIGHDGIGYRLNGYQFQRVTTHAIEQAWARCNLASAYCTTFDDRGHKVWYVTMTDGMTWGYDVATGEWHRRKSYGLDFWRMADLVRWDGRWIGGDYSNGQLYQLDWRLSNDDGQPLERSRTFAVMHDSQNRVHLNALELVYDTGITEESPPLPQVVIPMPTITGDMGDGFSGNVEVGTYTTAGGIPPRVVTLTAGTFTPGITLSPDGSWSGTRTTTGVFTWTVMVTDADGMTDSLDDESTTGIPPDTLIVPTNIHFTDSPGNLTFVSDASPTLRGEAIPVCSADGFVLAGADGAQLLAIYEYDLLAGAYDTATITGDAPNLSTANAIQTVAISADGDWVFSLDVGTPNIVVLHRTAPGEYAVVETYVTAAGNTGSTNGQRGIILSPDGTRLASVTGEGAAVVRTFNISASGQLTLEHTSTAGVSGSCFRLDWEGRYIVHEDYSATTGAMRVLDADDELTVLHTEVGAQHRLVGWTADATHLYTIDNNSPHALKAWIWDGSVLTGSNTYTTNIQPDKGSAMSPARNYLAHFGLSDTLVYSVDGANLALTDTLTDGGPCGVWSNPGRIAP